MKYLFVCMCAYDLKEMDSCGNGDWTERERESKRDLVAFSTRLLSFTNVR